MESVTDITNHESQATEPWFQVMEPLSLKTVCERDLEWWSDFKRNEKYLTVHQDTNPFPMTDTFALSPQKRVRDSISVYKERMAKDPRRVHRMSKVWSRLTKPDATNKAASTEKLSQKLRAYRQELEGNCTELTSEQLKILGEELDATAQMIQQKLAGQ